MNNNYEAPQIEVIEIEIEDAVMANSGLESGSANSNSNLRSF